MLTLEQIKSLVDKECDYQQAADVESNGCEECPIFNLFGRHGNCAFRVYDGQYRPEVAELIKELHKDYEWLTSRENL